MEMCHSTWDCPNLFTLFTSSNSYGLRIVFAAIVFLALGRLPTLFDQQRLRLATRLLKNF